MYRYLAILITLLLSSANLSAQTADTTEEAIPVYDVEIIIFKNTRVPKGREYVLPVSSPTRDDRFFDPFAQVNPDQEQPSDFVTLADSTWQLADIADKIDRSSRYDLLLHTAWRQPGLGVDEARPVWIQAGRLFGKQYISIDSAIESEMNSAQPAPSSTGLETNIEASSAATDIQTPSTAGFEIGSNRRGLYQLECKITISLSRYLHAYVDLVLRRPRLSLDPVDSSTQARYLAEKSPDLHILNNHRLKEHRRMRSKKLHYLDNPEFGMLILINPFAPATDDDSVPESTTATTAVGDTQ